MSFEIYEMAGSSVMARHPLKLAGYNFIYNTWQNLGAPSNGWVAQNAFINKELQTIVKTGNELKILISTMNYEFFVEEIWGWTYKDHSSVQWTPLLFVGNEVAQDKDTVEMQENHLYQFMYLQGDNEGWIFGAGGPNTSPLLFDETFDWFRRAIK